MATCSPQELLDDAPCFNALAPGQWQLVQLVLLCRILQALDPVATCNVQSLLDEAACFGALTPGQWRVVELQLLCEINANLVNALPLCGNGDPNGVVTGTICGQSYTDLDTGAEYRFQGVVGTNTGWA